MRISKMNTSKYSILINLQIQYKLETNDQSRYFLTNITSELNYLKNNRI